MIEIDVGYVQSKIKGNLEEKIVNILRKKLSYDVTNVDHINRQLKKRYSKFSIPEKRFLFHKRNHTFPSGLVFLVKKILNKLNIEYKVNEMREEIPLLKPLLLTIKSLRDYQEDMERKALEKKNCVIRAATGAGKTLVMTSLVGKLNGYKRAIFVRRTMLLYQTKEKIEEELKVKVGIIGDGVVDIKDITLIMIPTAARAIDPKFKFEKVDEDDEDDKNKYSMEQKDKIKKYLQSLNMAIFDECFLSGTRILTEDGWKNIEHLVKTKYDGKVWSYNVKKKKMELKRVTNWYCRATSSEIMKVCLYKSTDRYGVNCTPNHKFYMKDGTQKRADELREGDVLMVLDNFNDHNTRGKKALSYNQMQVARGTILGDGYLYKHHNSARLQWTHCLEQEEYLKWKLGVFGCEKRIITQRGGWGDRLQKLGRTCGWWQLKQLHEQIYIEGRKKLSYDYLQKVDELGLAVWFMDDGSYQKSNKYYSLYTNGFSHEEHLIVQKYFREKWKVNPRIQLDKKSNSHFLTFSKKDSVKISDIISPYLVDCMKYKGYNPSFPPKDVNFKFLDYGLVEVGKVKRNVKTQGHLRLKNGGIRVYNLTVEGNHNYIANGFLVSNCHCISTRSVQLISQNLQKARYLQGFSATPYREDGTDILIHASTGPKVIDISASFLIDKGYLVPPHISFFESPKPSKSIFEQKKMKWHQVYKEFIVENEERNNMIVRHAINLYNDFAKVVILVKHIKHGETLLKKIEEALAYAEWISGKNTMTTRKRVMAIFSTRSRAILLGSSILDEGVDLPAMTALINAGGGKSSSKYYQQIGRSIRVDPKNSEKTKSIVIDYLDKGVKYLGKHAKNRIKLIKTEPKYVLNFPDNLG